MEHYRRLSDKIIAAHGQACAEGRLDVAECLLNALEIDLSAFGGKKPDNRQNTEVLEAAYERHRAAQRAAAK